MIKICWCRRQKLWPHNLFLKYLHFKKVAIFPDIIKIVTIFIKTIIQDSRNVKRIMNYVSKSNLYLYFLMQQNLLISVEKMLMPAELKGLVTWFIYFLGLPWVRYNSTEFHHCRISWAAPKKPILNRVNGYHVFQAGIMCLQLWCHQWRIQKILGYCFQQGISGQEPKKM